MKVRWGIIGCGNISHTFVKALKYLPPQDHQIVCVGSQSLERAEKFKESLSLSCDAVGSYHDLLSREDVDIVYIGNQNHQHVDTTLEALQAGKHVLCEKPLGINTVQIETMLKAAEQADKLLMEGFWSRCFPAYAQIREELNKGSIGKPLIITGVFGGNFGDRLLNRAVGASTLTNIGCYLIQFATFIFGNSIPKTRSAEAKLKHGVDETMSFVLEWEGGEWAQFLISSSVDLGGEVTVYGEKGTLKIPDHFWCPSVVDVCGKERHHPLPPGWESMGSKAGFQYEAMAVRDALINGERECTLVRLEDSLAVIQIMDALRHHIGVSFPQDVDG